MFDFVCVVCLESWAQNFLVILLPFRCHFFVIWTVFSSLTSPDTFTRFCSVMGKESGWDKIKRKRERDAAAKVNARTLFQLKNFRPLSQSSADSGVSSPSPPLTPDCTFDFVKFCTSFCRKFVMHSCNLPHFYYIYIYSFVNPPETSFICSDDLTFPHHFCLYYHSINAKLWKGNAFF